MAQLLANRTITALLLAQSASHYQYDSLTNFLIFSGFELRRHKWLDQQFREFTGEITKQLFGGAAGT
jgi:hypothetical protein